MPKKFDVKNKIKGARAGFACTKDDLALLERAARLEERTSIGEFIRAHIMPTARQIVANRQFCEMANMMNLDALTKSILANSPELDRLMEPAAAAALDAGIDEAIKKVRKSRKKTN